jgi:Fe-S-cluster containining protein
MNAGESSFLETLREQARQISVQGYGQSATADTQPEAHAELGVLLDQNYRSQTRLSMVACKAGCSHCCHRVARARITEVIAVARHILSSFSEEELGGLRKRLYDYERVVAPSLGRDTQLLRPTCPLLVNGLCSTYEQRPLMCRGIFSPDAGICEKAKLQPQSTGFPVLPDRMQIAQSVWAGLEQGLNENSRDSNIYDFGRALRIAVENPSAMDTWLEDGSGFGPALIPPPRVDPRPSPASPPHPTYGADEEPLGKFDVTGLMLSQYLTRQGSFKEALSSANGSHPAYRLWKVRVPFTYASEDEVLEWREYFSKALDEFAASKFDPKEAYDALASFCPHELVYQQFNNRDLLTRLGDLLCNQIAAPALPDLTQPIDKLRPPGKLRIGYISRNLRNSSCAPWGLGWLVNQSDDFETYAFHIGEAEDQVSARFKEHADHYYHLAPGPPVPQQARFIKGLDLDALIYLDVGTNPRTTPFATLRLACHQFAAWGGPETSGLPTIDYYLSSDWMEPTDGDLHYSEKLVRLPGTGVCFLQEKLQASTMIRSDFGLDDGPLYLSVQHAPKLAPKWDSLYRKINEATGRPIVFIDMPRTASQVVWDRMRKNGVQFVLLPHMGIHDYLALLGQADVVLDSPGWNGGITSIHALHMRSTVVTLPTDIKRGRQSLALLKAANASDLVARDEDDYVDLVANTERRLRAAKDLDPAGMYGDLNPVTALEDFIRRLVPSG